MDIFKDAKCMKLECFNKCWKLLETIEHLSDYATELAYINFRLDDILEYVNDQNFSTADSDDDKHELKIRDIERNKKILEFITPFYMHAYATIK